MKNKIIALSLCMALATPITSYAYVTSPKSPSDVEKTQAQLNGYSEETWSKLMDNTLEYVEIEDLVKNFNVNISSAWSKFNENVDSLSMALDTLKAARREMSSNATVAMNDGDVVNTILYKAQGKGLGMSIQAMSIAKDKLSRQVTSTNAPIRNAQDQVVAGVRALMIGYKNIENQEKILESMIKMYEEAIRVTNQTESLGLATNADIIKAQSDLANARANLLNLKANKDKLYRTLITMCGWSPDAVVTVADIPDVSEDDINKLNPSVDINTAIGNNATLIKNRHNTSSKSSSFVEAKLYQSNQDEDMLRANINELYNNIITDKGNLAAANVGVEAANATENALDTQRRLGMLSTAQYLGGKLSVLQKQAELESARLQLKTDYNAYMQALSGNIAID
ncbi:TolC family protein [Lachnoanaerobaculum gingivalis]|uniref:TolC family protein n=1 Tax=Lachnoanaerobaculum gingivalis TaxID=2490855 RepID=A0A3P3QYY2_9FIRM|nr:TolC family protein [Lachnoanaerobaculum gingivalis]RRJ25600.1 TolC family protein [Lachnoanaerobaculum gingivalis]